MPDHRGGPIVRLGRCTGMEILKIQYTIAPIILPLIMSYLYPR